jgi:hypothetical protein
LNPGREAYSSLLYRLSYPNHVSNLHITSLIYSLNPLSVYKRFSEGSPNHPSGNRFQLAMVLFTKENFPTSVLIFLDLFSNSDQLYSDGMAPVTCPLYLSTLFHRYMPCRAHTSLLSSCAEPRIPKLGLPYDGQISQLHFVPGLKCLSDILCMDLSTPLRIRE